MALASHKDYGSASNYPRALSSIIISVGLLAVFITLASWILLSFPVGTVVRSYFYGVDQTSDLGLSVSLGGLNGSQVRGEDKTDFSDIDLAKSEGTTEKDQNQKQNDGGSKNQPGEDNQNQNAEISKDQRVEDIQNKNVEGSQNQNAEGSQKEVPSGDDTMPREQATNNTLPTEIPVEQATNNTQPMEIPREKATNNPLPMDDRDSPKDELINDASADLLKSETSPGNTDSKESVDSECDLYHGEWFYDSAGPLYTNNSCPVITQMQNCQGNGRPDKEYESWRWKPAQCELPRFNATKFLELMKGKTLAFVGDSVARNQMESLMCLLWQVETPKNRGNRHMQRWFFKSKSVMIVRIWSSWLVHQTSEASGDLPSGVAKLHLDVPDEVFMQNIPNFDVVVLSSGHWFAKQSVYMLNNQMVGTQLWSPPKKQQPLNINNVDAFGISVETSLTAMATHPNFTGLTILRAYSPDHYEGGAWNTGGSCTGKVRPILPGQLVKNDFTNIMHEKQVNGFYEAVKKQTNRSKLKLLDITEPFSYRHDGHPGPYRSPDPNKITKRGPDGKPPPQDCLHWCMPGPVDTWNELVLEVIRREFEGNQNPTV
ncbi:LOW QUALITY PROTEIN: protein YLS7-like [Chenopodium quinoa]|uniref:Trichome birefringence-like N-terminal domain-containing protein n=1 Tax=Chenopodium quinoa TaxID=63459 RepID=A0A803NBL4_CHEQI|nr:protein YLS7-like [Chenopodium quinoa]XP_021725281.1 LOW QUALITY PROTEIN: protein YLS7-like [Chenopodium quinoa]